MRKVVVQVALILSACSSDPGSDPIPMPGDNGLSQYDAGYSCNQIKHDHPASATGVYWIDPAPGGGDPVQVFCDMDSGWGGWTLVMKLTAGVPGDPSAIWFGPPLNDGDTALLGTGAAASHYLSRIVPEYWNRSGYTFGEAAIRFYDNGVPSDTYFAFDATATTRDSWFSASRLYGSSYPTPPDVSNTSGYGGFFSIAGDPYYLRRFFINDVYGGCPTDAGWLVVDAGPAESPYPCGWENPTKAGILIAYSAGPGSRLWEDTGRGQPDVMAVYVR